MVRRSHSPLSLLCITTILRVRIIFFEITTLPISYYENIPNNHPATIVLDNTVVVLRRSPAAVVHQYRHHAIVLTELFPDTLLDRSPGIVIVLNVC